MIRKIDLRTTFLLIFLGLFVESKLNVLQAQDTLWASSLKNRLEQMADSLSNNLKLWKVPDRVFKVEKYGAKADGMTMNTVAIQKAVDACSSEGGGVVLFSKGDYVTGTIRLRSGVMIEVAEGARILGSTKLEDYPEIVEDLKSVMSEFYKFRQSLIYAEHADKVGIRGKGEIYFRGEKKNFSSPQTTGFIKGRPLGIRMINCTNIVVKDILLRNSASWMQNYVACESLIFDGMRVVNIGNFNNDGLDPDGCRNVIVRNCMIRSEDDAMCLKGASGFTTENVLIENSIFFTTCNAFKVGTDTQGDFHNILVRNVTLGGIPDSLPTADNIRQCSTGITVATVDGGNISGVYIKNIEINQSRCPIFIRIGDRGRVLSDELRPSPGFLKNIMIEGVTGRKNFRQGAYVAGIPGYKVKDVIIRNYSIEMEGGGTYEMVLQNVHENEGGYPDAHKFSKFGLPSYGFFLRHLENAAFENMKIKPLCEDKRPEIYNGGDVTNVKYNEWFIK